MEMLFNSGGWLEKWDERDAVVGLEMAYWLRFVLIIMTGTREGVSLVIWWSNEESVKYSMVLIFLMIHEAFKIGVVNPYLFCKAQLCQYLGKVILYLIP